MLALDSVETLQDHLKRIVADIALQPEYRWREAGGGTLVRLDADGTPAVRVAVANAKPAVRTAAGRVVAGNDQGGVADLIEELLQK